MLHIAIETVSKLRKLVERAVANKEVWSPSEHLLWCILGGFGSWYSTFRPRSVAWVLPVSPLCFQIRAFNFPRIRSQQACSSSCALTWSLRGKLLATPRYACAPHARTEQSRFAYAAALNGNNGRVAECADSFQPL